MQSTYDGASSQGHAHTEDKGPLGISPILAATPESIHWTRTRYERASALRHERIAIEAYFISQARGFEPGHETEDWVVAQSRIDAIDSGRAPG